MHQKSLAFRRGHYAGGRAVENRVAHFVLHVFDDAGQVWLRYEAVFSGLVHGTAPVCFQNIGKILGVDGAHLLSPPRRHAPGAISFRNMLLDIRLIQRRKRVL